MVTAAMFTITASAAAARVGWIQSADTAFATPTCLVYARRGLPLHLTRETLTELVQRASVDSQPTRRQQQGADNSKLAPNSIAVGIQLHVDSLITSPLATTPPANVPDRFKKQAARWLGLQGTWLLATQRDPVLFEDDLGTTDKQGVVVASKGRQRVTPAEYMRALSAMGPGVAVTAMTDTVAATSSPKRLLRSVQRSLAFLDACLSHQEPSTSVEGGPQLPALWGVVQGGVDVDLRLQSARATGTRPVAGFVIDGFGTGEDPSAVGPALAAALSVLPTDRPRFVPGLSSPEEIVAGVAAGVDLFDSGFAVRVTELGGALTLEWPVPAASHHINLWDSQHQNDRSPLVAGCRCYACEHHTRAYISHLLQTHELLAPVLLIKYALVSVIV